MPGRRDETAWIAPALALLAVGLGGWLRLRGFPSLLLYGDELHSLELSRESYATIVSSFEPYGSGIALPLLQRVARDLCGDALWAFRLPALVGGLAALAIFYPVAVGLVGRPAAAVGTLAMALSPLQVYYAHFARSYALAVFLALLLVHCLDRPGRLRAVLAVGCVALLPWVHLTALGFVLSAGLGSLLALGVEGRLRSDGRRLAGVFAAGAGLGLLLYVPAWEPTTALIGAKLGRGEPDFGAGELAALLGGGPAAAPVWLVGVPAAALWMLRERRGTALLLGAVSLLPIACIAAADPVGGVYAWARYLLPSLPFQLLLLAWAVTRLGALPFRSPRAGERAGLALGLALVGLSWWLGPLGRQHRGDASAFANLTYSLLPRGADADAPRPDTPAFYRRLAADAGVKRIVEAPALASHDLKLYRNYQLQHGREVWLGYTGPSRLGLLRPGPYVDLRDSRALRRSGAAYLVLHRDVEAELGRRAVPRARWRPAARRLEAALGAPAYEDAAVLVWRLGPEPSAVPPSG